MAGRATDVFDINHIQVDPASFSKKRKRSSTACVRCHERKIKCDAAASPNNAPCKNCVSAGVPCRTHVDGRTRAGLAAQQDPGPEPLSSASTSTSSAPGTFPLQIPSPPTREPHLPMDRFEAYVEDNMGSFAPSFRTAGTQESNSSSNNNTPEGIASTISMGSLGSVPAVAAPGTTTVSVSANSVLQLSQLISPPSPTLHHPGVVEMATRTTIELEKKMSDLDAADLAYLEAKGAFTLPLPSIQTDLVEGYFSDVHPTAPVIDRSEFLQDFRAGRTQSRLLLFAIFTAGARVTRNPALLDAKGTNHSSALRFYRITKALLDTGYERNKLVRIQALLLITWWWDKKDDGGRNMRSCVVDAINTAQSIGMHRWNQYPRDLGLRRLWKRIWWYCVTRDAAVSVAHGLPCMPSLADTDVEALVAEDFVENTGQIQQQHPSYPDVEVRFMIEQVRLTEALRLIHHRYFVHQRLNPRMTGSIASRELEMASGYPSTAAHEELEFYQDEGLRLCREFIHKLPPVLKYDVDDVQGHQFWPAFLHILYFTGIMLRFREVSVSRPTTNRGLAERQYCRARGVAAATMVSKIIRNLRAHGHLLRCTGQLTTSLFNCLTFFLMESQMGSSAVRQDARHKYTLCLNQLYEFSQLWVSASLVHRLFEDLQAKLLLPEQQQRMDLTGGSSTDSPPPWHELFPGFATSSDLPETYVHQLIDADFQYAERIDSTSAGSSWTLPSPEGDLWSSGLDQPIIGGIPATLDVDVW